MEQYAACGKAGVVNLYYEEPTGSICCSLPYHLLVLFKGCSRLLKIMDLFVVLAMWQIARVD